jgi:two-component sensor histidine kinase
MIERSIGFNVNDVPRSVCALMEQLHPVFESRGAEPCRVDLSKCRYLGPDAATVVAALVRLRRSRGEPIEVILPTEPPELDAFCAYSGLKEVIGGTPDLRSGRIVESIVVPLRELHDARHDDVEPIVRLIREHVEVSEELQLSLGIAFSEVIQNVEDHARSPVGAVTAARYMTGRHEVRVAVVDMGEGIGTTLRRARPDIGDTRLALYRVLQGGYSSRSRKNNLGQGVNNLRISVTGRGGELFIVTEDAGVVVRAGREPKLFNMKRRFPGSGVFFTLPTRLSGGV